MTTRQTPDAVREAYIRDMGAALRPTDRSVAMAAFDAGYAAALDSRAGDAGEGISLNGLSYDQLWSAIADATSIAAPGPIAISAMRFRGAVERLSATPAPAVDDDEIDSPAARLDMVRVALSGIIDNPASAVPLARAGLDFCDLTQAQRQEMRGDA